MYIPSWIDFVWFPNNPVPKLSKSYSPNSISIEIGLKKVFDIDICCPALPMKGSAFGLTLGAELGVKVKNSNVNIKKGNLKNNR